MRVAAARVLSVLVAVLCVWKISAWWVQTLSSAWALCTPAHSIGISLFSVSAGDGQIVFMAASLAMIGITAVALVWLPKLIPFASVLACLNHSQSVSSLTASARRGKQLCGETIYWMAFGICVTLVAALVFIPGGPTELIVDWLVASFRDANLLNDVGTEASAAAMLPAKLAMTAYLLWWWVPKISELSSLASRLFLNSLGERKPFCENLADVVNSETKVNLRPANPFLKNCILSLGWLSICFTGWIALVVFHPTPLGESLHRCLSVFALPYEVEQRTITRDFYPQARYFVPKPAQQVPQGAQIPTGFGGDAFSNSAVAPSIASTGAQTLTPERDAYSANLAKEHRAILAALGPLEPLPSFASPLDHNNHAVFLGRSGRWEEALKEHVIALKGDPYNSAFRRNLDGAFRRYGQVLLTKQDWQGALHNFRMAIYVDANDLGAIEGLNASYKGLGENPLDWKLHKEQGMNLERGMNVPEAVAEYRVWVRIEDSALAHAALGEALLKQGDKAPECDVEGFQELKLSLTKDWAKNQSKELGHVHLLLADKLKELAWKAKFDGRNEIAMKRWVNAGIEYRRAVVLLNGKDKHAAQGLVQVARDAVGIDSKSLANHLTLAAAYRMLGDSERAKQQDEICCQLKSSNQTAAGQSGVHEHYWHYSQVPGWNNLRPISVYRECVTNHTETPEVPSRFFFAALTALGVTPLLALMGSVWLPFRRQPKLAFSREGMFFPLAQSGPLWLRPFRLWEDVQSIKLEKDRLCLQFLTGGNLAIDRNRIELSDRVKLLQHLKTFAPGAYTGEVDEFAHASIPDSANPVGTGDDQPFLLDNLVFVRRYFSELSLVRQVLLAVPLLAVVSIERLLLLFAKDNAHARCSIAAVCRTILKSIMAPLVVSPKLLYVFSFLVPVALIACPKLVLIVFIPLCLITIALVGLDKCSRAPEGQAKLHLTERRLQEWLTNLKPFLLWGFYCSGVASVVLMVADAFGKILKVKSGREQTVALEPSSVVVLAQNKPADVDLHDYNFYHSAAFPVTTAVVYLLGVPAAITWSIFLSTVYGTPAGDSGSQWYQTNIPLSSVMPYLLVQVLYLGGLGCAFSMIFFRSWFSLPLAHASTEYDVTLDATGAKQGNVKGWFADLLWYGWHEFFPREVNWNSVVAVDYEEKGFGRLSPLPLAIFKQETLPYRILKNMAVLTDTYVDSVGRATNIVLRTRYDKAFGHGLRIRLSDLDQHQKEQVLEAINQWAYKAQIDPRVKIALSDSCLPEAAAVGH